MSDTTQTIAEKEGLDYWRANAEEDYMKVPISVLKYISELEQALALSTQKEQQRAIHDSNPKIPIWITAEDIIEIKRLWSLPNIDNSNPRIQAVKLVKKRATDSFRTIDFKEANEILQICLNHK